jgi:hypothetical protein
VSLKFENLAFPKDQRVPDTILCLHVSCPLFSPFRLSRILVTQSRQLVAISRHAVMQFAVRSTVAAIFLVATTPTVLAYSDGVSR